MKRTFTLVAVMAAVVSAALLSAGAPVFAQEEEEVSGVTVDTVEVSPAEPVRGDTITVTATVTNPATTTQEQLLELMVGGVTVDSFAVSFAPEETKRVSEKC